ncbi:hypothetical protein [Kushneria indalinina]|uniref:Uncharacterized protein n=1 Tax=Kushneria indalinina DSM 14324 TaxID=1122140 RepID=A0A3D9DRM5_9GAMM|nr:hypothetical protein [Kushneria indalinina]REC93311.1 hypothetical protein C8D72_3467 [Kushneria indalinina DSM 14324]
MATIPKHLQTVAVQVTGNDNPTGRFWVSLLNGDGSTAPSWTFTTIQERDDKARLLAVEYGVEVKEREVINRERRARVEQAHQAELEAIRSAPMEFVDRESLVAAPTLCGILSDLGLSRLRERFPDNFLLPVSQRVAKRFEREGRASYMIVSWGGKGVAMNPREAEAFGLEEAPNWLPDTGFVPTVPQLSDFEAEGFDIAARY